jgi:uncharacterized protein YdeI (YjbR/CyaY-like superfamily)
MQPTFFDTAAHFRHWLEQHHASATELLVGFRKVDSGLPSMTWPESVDEALCFGWIDGVRRRIDELSYSIRFSPRRVGSIWSKVNLAKIELLMAAGRLHPAGRAAFEARSEKKTGVYAFEQQQAIELSVAERELFAQDRVAWAYFERCPPSYRKTLTYWVVSAKRAETRAKRLQQLITACSEQRRILK